MKYFFFIAILLANLSVAPGVTVAQSLIRPHDRIAIVGNTFADQLRIHGYLETALRQHVDDVSVRNLGWAGDMLSARDRPTNFVSEESILNTHQTDVIIACFGMGESFGGADGIDQFRRDYETFITTHAGKTYNGESEVRLVIVSPIASEDLGKLTPDRDGRNQDLRAYTQAAKEIATSAGLPFVDLFETSRYLMDEPAGPNLTTNGVHLNSFGYWAISHSFTDQLLATADTLARRPAWRLTIDVASNFTDEYGVQISDLAVSDSVVSFQVTETSPPRLPPPTSHSPTNHSPSGKLATDQLAAEKALPPQLEFLRDQMTVRRLPPGDYTLSVDQQDVVTAAAEQWSSGVVIDSSPAHREAQEFREAINDKNLQFTYSWKALNQVHIVGERRTSPSGRELPKEVIQFNELAKQRDRKLRSGVELKTRQWRLTRVQD